MRALQYPRWEDYDYESEDADENLMYWLGDGQTWNEKSLTGDSTSSDWCSQDLHLNVYRGVVLAGGFHRPSARCACIDISHPAFY